MGTTLIITNDFPPRQGGIETFVHAMATRVPDNDVVVYTSSEPGAAEFDATLPFPVIRDPGRTLLPTRRATARALDIARRHGCDRVWFGAAAPLAAMAPALRRAGIRRIVATTHGHEIWWARVPGARRLLRRVGNSVDVVTYLGEYTRARIAPALGPRARMSRLVPGVDSNVFRPDLTTGRKLRQRYGLQHRTVILCVARLVPRKGQDTLIRAMPLIRRMVPDAALLIVGRGPDERRLRRLADRHAPGAVVFAGGSTTPRHPPTTRRPTCSPCPAARAGRDWRRRDSASSSWRRPRPVCPCSRGTPAGRRTRSSTGGPEGSSTAAKSPRSPTPWPSSWSPRAAPRRAPRDAAGSRRSGPGRPRPGT